MIREMRGWSTLANASRAPDFDGAAVKLLCADLRPELPHQPTFIHRESSRQT